MPSYSSGDWGCSPLADLIKLTDDKLLDLRGFGPTMLAEALTVLGPAR
jgi:hypothetical protein